MHNVLNYGVLHPACYTARLKGRGRRAVVLNLYIHITVFPNSGSYFRHCIPGSYEEHILSNL